MNLIGRIAPATLLLTLTACASTARMPITEVPAGNYVLVEPASDTYQALSINDRAYTMRVGNALTGGEMWLDVDDRLYLAANEGPCAGQPSIWSWDYDGRRVTLDLVEDTCMVRAEPVPSRLVYERR